MKHIRSTIFASALAMLTTSETACQKPPPSTADDAGKEVACITAELIAGDRDPVLIEKKCQGTTAALIADVSGSLDLYRVTMAAPGCPDTTK